VSSADAGQWWSRTASGRVQLRLAGGEAATILGLLADLRSILDDPDSDPTIMARLFPRAYLDPTEEQAELTWRALAGPDLLRERFDRLDRLRAALEPVALGDRTEPIVLDEQAEADWSTVLNDTRLTLGTAIGVGDDTDEDDEPDEDDPNAAAWHLYHVLTYFQGELIDVLLDALPIEGIDEP
jgi:Domain of unknown function (DUF2017)